MTCLPKGELSGANVAQAPDSGRGGGIRTPDILLPKQARYQTALHPENAGLTLARRAVYPHCQYWAMSQKNTSFDPETLQESPTF